MQLSAKTQNACLALLELARHYDRPQPVCLKMIAEAHQLSSPFLVQILLLLKRAGIVTSTRGASGGYRLAQSPDAISLWDVILAIEGPPPEWNIGTDSVLGQALYAQWSAAVAGFQNQLAEITLSQMLESVSTSSASDMYYI